MLVAEMQPGKEFVRIAAGRSAYAQVSVVVASPHDARLVSHPEAVGTVVPPEGFRTDMAAGDALRPLQVAVGEELLRMAVVYFMLVSERHVHPVLV